MTLSTARSLCISRWLVPITPKRQQGIRLICFPYAGAGASVYRSWSTLLGPDIEAFAVRPPGRETRFTEDLLTGVSDYAQQASEAIAALPDDRPLVLFGHSLGALAGYETAVRLTQAGQHIAKLVVSGRQDPDSPGKRKHISHLPNAEFAKEMAAYNGTPAEVLANEELLELLLPMIKADFAMSERYPGRSGTLLSCPVLALASRQDSWLDAHSIEGWKQVTSGTFETGWFEGDHFYLNHHTAELIAFLSKKMPANHP